MTKEKLRKILKESEALDINSIPVEEKKSIQTFFMDYGFTMSTFYLRFFQKGFSEWEILGVENCKEQFLALPDVAKCLLDYVETDVLGAPLGDKGYLYTLAKSDKPNVFYSCLKKAQGGLCVKFGEFMAQKGMSGGTTIKRFTDENWKPWENIGIQTLLEKYIASAHD